MLAGVGVLQCRRHSGQVNRSEVGDDQRQSDFNQRMMLVGQHGCRYGLIALLRIDVGGRQRQSDNVCVRDAVRVVVRVCAGHG